jgi:AraC-like DNA-binding protein
MNQALKELAHVEYSEAAVKVLSIEIPPHSLAFNLHWHDRIEIIKIKKGNMTIEAYGSTYNLSEGDIALFTPKTAHKGYTDEALAEYDVLMFDIRSFYNETPVCKSCFPYFFDGNAKFENVFRDSDTSLCIDKICGNEDHNSLEIISLVYQLIFLLFRKHLLKIEREPKTKIKELIDYIEKNYTEEIDTQSLSQIAGYSEEHFCRKFKSATGITPMTYLKIYRLEQALKMIKENEHTISEIALLCGFSDANYFARCFKAHYGNPPRYYIGKNDI